MRKIFQGQDAVYFNLNSFSLSEPYEYFWTFRAYEIAVQSKLKLFVLSAGPDRFKSHGYEERFRNAHGTVSARLADWLSHQPLDILPWSIAHGGVYAEMLWSLLSPLKNSEGVYEFRAPIGEKGSIPLVPLDDYGVRTKWMFEHPDQIVGKTIRWAPLYTKYDELARAFEETTSQKAMFRDVSQDDWFRGLSAYKDPESKIPADARKDDDAVFTFRQTFGGWWNLWKHNLRDEGQEAEARKFADSVHPERFQSIKEWMKAASYTGGFKSSRFKHGRLTNSSQVS